MGSKAGGIKVGFNLKCYFEEKFKSQEEKLHCISETLGKTKKNMSAKSKKEFLLQNRRIKKAGVG